MLYKRRMTANENDTASERPAIRLDQFLKREGLVGSGGEAKVMIQAGEVRVNGAVETRRRKQLQTGDIVEFGGSEVTVAADV